MEVAINNEELLKEINEKFKSHIGQHEEEIKDEFKRHMGMLLGQHKEEIKIVSEGHNSLLRHMGDLRSWLHDHEKSSEKRSNRTDKILDQLTMESMEIK